MSSVLSPSNRHIVHLINRRSAKLDSIRGNEETRRSFLTATQEHMLFFQHFIVSMTSWRDFIDLYKQSLKFESFNSQLHKSCRSLEGDHGVLCAWPMTSYDELSHFGLDSSQAKLFFGSAYHNKAWRAKQLMA